MDRNYYLIALLSIIFFSMYFGAPELTKAPLASATLVTQSTLVREGVNVD